VTDEAIGLAWRSPQARMKNFFVRDNFLSENMLHYFAKSVQMMGSSFLNLRVSVFSSVDATTRRRDEDFCFCSG
jgi:hypothetical protein